MLGKIGVWQRWLVGGGIIAAWATAPVVAATIYIAPNGDDSRSGLTPAQAMTTLKTAQSRAAPGDTAEIAGGTYPWVEGTWIYVAGTASKGIFIRAAVVAGKFQTVTIMGDGRAGRPNNYCLGTGSAWIEIRGITCENFADFGILIYGGHDIRLLNNTMRRLGNSGFAIYSDLQDRRQPYRMLASSNIIADTNRRWAQTSGISG